MSLYLSSPSLQLITALIVILFALVSFKKTSFVLRLFPILLPFYLIKLYLNPQLLWEGISSRSFSLFLNSFFNPLYKEYPVLPLNFGEEKITALPTNLLEVALVIFLIINHKLILRGVHLVTKTCLGKYFFSACTLLLVSFILSTGIGLNQKVSLGITKSWFILPFLLFLALVPYLSISRFRTKFLNSLALSGIVLIFLNFPFLISSVLTYDHRLSGIYLSPNHLGMALAPGMIALFILLLPKKYLSFGEKERGQLKFFFANLFARAFKIIILFLLLLSLLLLYATFSYGTWLSLIFAFFFFHLIAKMNVAQSKNSLKLFFTSSLLTLIVLTALFFSQFHNPKLQSILKGDYYSSFHSRQMIWNSALSISQEHFFFGIGPGNFQRAYLDYAKRFSEPYLEWTAPEPHNLFLAFLTQLGAIGLVFFVLILFFTLKMILSKLQAQTTNKRLDPLSLWAFIYLLYTLLHGLIDTPYFKNDLSILFWMALAAIWGQNIKKKKRKFP